MLTHQQIWDGIDQLAHQHGLSPSGLAKRAGLDPTTFNKSKRATKQGKPRWPSTESLAMALEATSTAMGEFVGFMTDPAAARRMPRRLRSVSLDQVEKGNGLDTAGFPVGGNFEHAELPLVEDEHAYLLELDRDLAAPVLRRGDQLVVAPSSAVRRGDRAVARLRSGPIIAGILVRRSSSRVVINDLMQPDEERGFLVEDLAWLARIAWIIL